MLGRQTRSMPPTFFVSPKFGGNPELKVAKINKCETRHIKELISSEKLAKYGFNPPEFEELLPSLVVEGSNPTTKVQGDPIGIGD
ncbi:unnamed protein product [Ilex paraguariensis]|uniref:Uncharacterized protein n=1 Tax=Ilex paraguariensis TaxID=185542 RepID=A0ABC8R7K2_9AQUA